MNIAWRIYRRLARAFPQEFKMAYGAEVMQLGRHRTRWRHGLRGGTKAQGDRSSHGTGCA